LRDAAAAGNAATVIAVVGCRRASRGITTPLAVGSMLSLTLQGVDAKKVGGSVSLLLFAAGAQAASLSYEARRPRIA
jgi:hypothetical protein